MYTTKRNLKDLLEHYIKVYTTREEGCNCVCIGCSKCYWRHKCKNHKAEPLCFKWLAEEVGVNALDEYEGNDYTKMLIEHITNRLILHGIAHISMLLKQQP